MTKKYGNVEAGEGQVWVCLACGKMSKDKYGFKKISHGWDESCMLNSALCWEDKIVIKNGMVVNIQKDGAVADEMIDKEDE